jgi:DNA-binding MarR family transcriptional regulator
MTTSEVRVSGPEEYVPRDHFLWLTKRLFHHGHRLVDDAVRGYGVTAAQHGVLTRLYAEPGLSGAELARRLLVTPQAAQLALSALERQGLVKRTPDPDHGRIVRTSLTSKGRRVVERAMAEALAAEARLLAPLDAEEQKTLIALLQRLLRQVPADSEPGYDEAHAEA